MRTLSFAALVVSAILVLTATVLGQANRNRARSDQTRSLTVAAEAYAGSIAAAMKQSQMSLLLASGEPALRDLLERPGSAAGRRAAALHEPLHALARLQRLLRPTVREAGILDATGHEVLRVLRGAPLPPAVGAATMGVLRSFALSATERWSVYESGAYRSASTHEWVIAEAAPVLDGARRIGALYLELPVAALRRLVPTRTQERLRLFDGLTGSVVVDSEARGAAATSSLRASTLPPQVHGRSSGVFDSGVPTAFRWVATMKRSNDWLNPNQWLVLATPEADTPSTLAAFARVPLALLVVALVLGCGALFTLRISRRILERAADHDALTGLRNRRALMRRLNRIAASNAAVHLVLYDLNGFKAYNDNFGHQAGDALLERLGGALQQRAPRGADVYRLGGDEFCLLCEPEHATELELVGASALSEQGNGFEISASWGAAVLPAEAATPSELLRLADQRMYEHKQARRSTPAGGIHEALLQLVEERDPDLARHQSEVAELAERTARALELDEDVVRHVRQGAALHDLGKVALPDTVLRKPGPLDARERAFIERHTLIGERILLAAPPLAPAAPLVRSSHERWDGAGYPDGLRGTEIPLGARIIAVCEAYDEMTRTTPYRAPITSADAMAELRRGSGDQFDAAVVDAFAAALADGAARREPAGALAGGPPATAARP